MNSIHLQIQLNRSAFMLDVDLQLPGQGITAIFGASGSGKTTLLRAVAGLEKNQQGRIQIGAHIWQDTQQGIVCLPGNGPWAMCFKNQACCLISL